MAIRKGGKAVLINGVMIPGPNLLTLWKPDRFGALTARRLH